MKLHQQGVDLLVDVMDTIDHLDTMPKRDMQNLLERVSDVMGQIWSGTRLTF
jgi:hypothetical protein